MCGIYLSVSRNRHLQPSKALQERLDKRGPDFQRSLRYTLHNDHGDAFYVVVYCTVLALRGDTVVEQPIGHDRVPKSAEGGMLVLSNCLLCWNGEAWTIDGDTVRGNDGVAVYDLLAAATMETAPKRGVLLRQRLAMIRGPFSFVFLDLVNMHVSFGRGCLGRRSLLTKADAHALLISSVNDGENGWHEVDANRISEVDLSTKAVSHEFPVEHYLHSSLFCLNRALSTSDLEKGYIDDSVVNQFHFLLRKALQMRLADLDRSTQADKRLNLSGLATLFSGGVDCTLLACIAHWEIPLDRRIDLLNVAFENPRVHGTDTSSPYEACPDRITARKALFELQLICPGREWCLVTIDIPYDELLAHRSEIRSLIYPHDTEMDLSIGSALYFAARAQGMIDGTSKRAAYTSPARVLLSGLGADELFGGYQRHATAFSKGNSMAERYNHLLDELELDMHRLGKRNLGRDDRVISHWGKEVRYPYLDEAVVAFAAAQPFWNKVGFGRSRCCASDGSQLAPDKLLIRVLAHRLGLRSVAMAKKRAIQFGARTAKMEKGRTKGTDVVQ